MAEKQSQHTSVDRKASRGLIFHDSPDEFLVTVQQYDVAERPTPNPGPMTNDIPAEPNAGSSTSLGDGYLEIAGSGRYQPNFCVSGFEQTYQEQTHYPQAQIFNHTSTDLTPSLAAYSDPNTLSDTELFWVQYHHGAHIGRDLFALWRGLQTDDHPPRETLRLIPNEDRNLQHLNGKLRPMTDENGEMIRSDLTDEILYDLPFLPRYIDMKSDATTKNIDNWIIMGADLRRDIIPRSINYNPYHSFDEDGVDFFNWRATTAHLQRTYTNKHMKRAEQPHVMGGLLRKFRMDKGRFAEFLTPITFDEQGNQRRLLLSMENLLFNTRWDIDLQRMVMRNPHSHQELPLFTPAEVRTTVRECLEKRLPHEKVPTLRDLFEKYPHIRGYEETKHPLFRRAEDHDSQLRRNWEMEAARRGHRRPAVTVTKPNFTKSRKEITSKRKQAEIQEPLDDLVEMEDDDEREERSKKKNKKESNHVKRQPWRKASAVITGRTKYPFKALRSTLSPISNHFEVDEISQHSTYSTYQETPQLETFHKATNMSIDMLLQPLPDLNVVPNELLCHPLIDCLDGNGGTYMQLQISPYYDALTPENRQLYSNIRATQGLAVAKQWLLGIWGLQEIIPIVADTSNDVRIIPNPFNDGVGYNKHQQCSVVPHCSVMSSEEQQQHSIYDPQLTKMEANIDTFNEGHQPDSFQPNIVSPWPTDETFSIAEFDSMGVESGEAPNITAVNMPLLDGSFSSGMDYTFDDTDEFTNGDWEQFDVSTFYLGCPSPG